jgi:glycosyltransferase involved in cell wall biosynthesis
LFYDDAFTKSLVEATYRMKFEFVTVADWIATKFAAEFGVRCRVVKNGIDADEFYPMPGLRSKHGRKRVLIEGPISVPFKGVAEAYEALKDLSVEIWMVSSAGVPEPSWRVDRFFHAVSLDEMREIYSSCDVLLKMSRVESFCLPALEAMACGCAVVLGKVAGGVEFAVDRENAVLIEVGDIAQAKAAVEQLVGDDDYRGRLVASGYRTAETWSFSKSADAMREVVVNEPFEMYPNL